MRWGVVALVGVVGCGGATAGTAGDSTPEGGKPDTGGPTDASTTRDANTVDGPYSNVPSSWQCLNEPVPAGDAGASVDVEFQFEGTGQGSQGTPVSGASIHGCNTLDVLCTSPVTPNAVSDDAGIAILSVADGFSGYYELRAPSFLNSILSRPPQYHSEHQLQEMASASASFVATAGTFVGVAQNPNDGFAFVSVLDCEAKPAAGISFSVEGNVGPDEHIVYLANNLPTTSATQTDSISGAAIVFNVPPGTLTLRASFASGLGIKTVSALVRPSQQWTTNLEIRPDQASWTPATED